ncbi:MAG: bifunctional phosphopantothenoylcysteine decarboxylase/phosphopantothenate--cysteine ligase CoaBC [Acidobacteria bacterium]|nr:bifunctional phosphopantothenoylcysteine decarboxylase/phosphopantothenate--cysteine ligase CoaBC [Acidobacteriota bacterium]
MKTHRRVLLGVTGGIAAFKSALIVRQLVARGCEVRCALTRGAEAFVTPLTLEVLSGHPVYREEYLEANGSGEELHITAAVWADVLCVAPATAHTLGRLAQGLADDFLTTTALAFTGPLVLAPAMHADMWRHPAVRANVAALEARSARLVGPVEGPLASGETGMGRLADPEAIVAEIDAALALLSAASEPSGALAGRRILVTAGPTFEPVDPVRFLGNRSSGKMGFAIAAAAARQGARTELVAGPVQLATPPGVERHDVVTAREMEAAVARLAPSADAVVMTAAVADFRPAHPAASKIKKGDGIPEIHLERNPDILAGLSKVAPQAVRVGFAAETGDPEREARGKLERKDAHWIVANDVSRGDIGFNHDDNEVTVYRREGPPVFLSRRPKDEVAEALVELLAERLGPRPAPGDEVSDREPRSVGR